MAFRNISLLITVLLLSINAGIVLPLIPPLFFNEFHGLFVSGTERDYRYFFYGLSIAAFGIGTLFGDMFWGICSDKIGRRKGLFISLNSLSIGYAVSAVSILYASITLFIFSRLCVGFASGAIVIATAAILEQRTEIDKPYYARWISIMSGGGFFLGPLISGTLPSIFSSFSNRGFSYCVPFILTATFSLLTSLFVFFSFRSSKHCYQLASPAVFIKLIRIDFFKSKIIANIIFIFFLFELSWFIFFNSIGLLLTEKKGFSALDIGFFISTMVLCYLGFLLTIYPILLKKLSKLKIFYFGLVAMFFSYPMLTIAENKVAFYLSSILLVTNTGMLHSLFLCIFSDNAGQEGQGKVMGIMNVTSALSYLMAALIIGYAGNISLSILFFTAGFFIFIILLRLKNLKFVLI
ncbi:MFS transporter [Legionella hackeliae]|uniref:Major facilitator superfamily (MFS) profile domain-containing protein n=1 Tax=Legionella hackeliae TaxID=449 RepID=A0A0A8UVV5_LEGHA|nr:MFS transporter [Legionella hackeliae]KTD06593.1 transporter of the major facilitator superfamily (MFS) [Legionella hackeliae]CEK11611.1 membrane protein of unknown function [Legionella hackeliae]STX48381.1 transporter of the major facilitator superfamily (MFS) [Legionella hackeliae]